MKVPNLRSRIEGDLTRFSKLHPWFKELPIGGENFIIFPWKGRQPKNYLCSKSSKKYHWHVWKSSRIEEIPISGLGKDIIMRRIVILNCFLYGQTDSLNGGSFCKGWGVIKQRYPNALSYLRKKYGNVIKINDMILLESHHQLMRAAKAVDEIINEMVGKAPVWLGLPRLPESDPTMQICQDNLKARPALVSSSDGTVTVNTGKSTIKRLTRKLSFRQKSTVMKD